MFGPPRTLSLILVTMCCLIGIRFLDFLDLFFGRAIGDSSTNAYRIFTVVPVNEPHTNVSFIAYFGFVEPSNSVGGRKHWSLFLGSGMGMSLGVRSSHCTVTFNPAIDSWRWTNSPPPDATGTFSMTASFRRACNSPFLPAIARPLLFNSSFSQATLSNITPSMVNSGTASVSAAADSASRGGDRSSARIDH